MSSSSKCLCPLAALLMSCVSLTSDLQAATTQKTTLYEAENAFISRGTIGSAGKNFSGTGFVNYANDNNDDYVEWTVPMTSAGSVNIFFAYLNTTDADRPLDIRVNGNLVSLNHSFINMSGDDIYRITAQLTVSLNAGINKIRATASGNWGPNVDYLAVVESVPVSGTIMTVYGEANLTGTSATVNSTHTIYSGATIPGGLDNQISSFVLSHGYMAVVAEQPDGLQQSKTYIADVGPLTVNALPSNLENAISFIRVVPWKNTQKKGICGGTAASLAGVNHSWYYKWNQDVASGSAITGPEYTPMSWNGGGASTTSITNYLTMNQVTHLLSFNEPDGIYQANIPDPLVAIPLHIQLQKAGLRLGSPACEEQDAYGTGKWLTDFMIGANSQDARVDYINVHWYDWGGSPTTNTNPNPIDVANRLKAYLANVYKQHRKPIWITEFNANPARSRSIQDGFLQEMLPYLEDIAYVERYAYYQWDTGLDTMVFRSATTGEITSTGQIYSDHPSTTAYVSGELPSAWQSADIGTANAGASLYNGNYTISGSGAGIASTTDGCRYVYQTVSGDSTITALVRGQIWRHNETSAGVMIRKDLTAGSPRASMALSWSNGARFRTRSIADGVTTTTTQTGIPKYPYWVRLVRKDDTFTGYTSPDGINWTQVGTPSTIAMGTAVYVGLAVTSNSDGSFNDVIFKNVSVTQTLGQSLYIDWTRNAFAGSFGNTVQTSNSDGDSLTNLQEFAFGTDPTSPLISALSFTTGSNNLQPGIPTLMKLPVSGQPDAYHALFSRRKNHAEAGLNYVVEFSADLTRWTTSSAGLTVRSENSAGTFEAVSVPFPSTVPANGDTQQLPPKFFRIGVDMP